MAVKDFSKYFIYRWRYVIGYSLIGLLLISLLLVAGLFLPGGLSSQEMESVVRSASLDFSNPATLVVTDLPYHLLQAGIFNLFGISIFTIKLPSLILAFLSAVGLIILLRRWFTPNIAVLTSLIAISTGQFLFIAQYGTPSVLYMFWPIALLLLGTQITRINKARTLWKILFVISAALSLYTPLGIYPLIAVLLATTFHPHLRAIIRRMRRSRIIISIAIFVILIAPLAWMAIIDPKIVWSLLGIPSAWPPDIIANTTTLAKQYFLFWQPSTTAVMTPVFGLGSTLLILIGAYRLIRTRETTRSYLVVFWVTLLIPVLLLNPAFTTVTFLPSVLMLAAGITSLIGYWYRLFPLNPYARIAGLVPIVILVAVLVTTGFARYAYGYHYGQGFSELFSKDLKLIPSETKQVIVSDDERAFFEAVADSRSSLVVVDKPTEKTFVATRDARTNFPGYMITRIITNPNANDSDRLYVFTKVEQKTQPTP